MLVSMVANDKLVTPSRENSACQIETKDTDDSHFLKIYIHLALLLTLNLQWSAFWKKENPSIANCGNLNLTESSAIGPAIELRQLAQTVKNQYNRGHISSYFAKLSKIILHTIGFSFGPGFETESLFRGTSIQTHIPSNTSILTKFVFPLNGTILTLLPETDTIDKDILENTGKREACEYIGLTAHSLRLIDLSTRWHSSSKLAIMRLAREAECPTGKDMTMTNATLNEYVYQVMPNLMPFEYDLSITVENEVRAGLLLNDIMGTVKKTGLDTLDSTMLECLIMQSLHLTCYLPRSAENNLTDQLCYEIVSAVGQKSWQDIIKRLKIRGTAISRVESDEAAAFLCTI
jgi:hypothetical protein